MKDIPGLVTALLDDWHNGNEAALSALMPIVYGELRHLAAGYLRRERADHTLQTTALVHEAYLRLVDQRRVRWAGRAHFLAIAAQMMRRILVDHARRIGYAKRGGGQARLALEEALDVAVERTSEVLALDEALSELAAVHLEASRMMELRFFGGLTNAEIAEALDVSPTTVTRRCRTARAWLYRYLSGAEPQAASPEVNPSTAEVR